MGIILGIIIFLLMGGSIALGVWLHYRETTSLSSVAGTIKDEILKIERKKRDEERAWNRYSYHSEGEKETYNKKIEEYNSTLKDLSEELLKNSPKLLKSILLYCLGGVLLLAFIFVPFSFHQINTGEVAVVKVWGKAEYTKSEGTHFDFWLGKKYQKYDTKVRQTECSTMAYSQDAQTMDVKLTVQYRIQVENVMKINKEFGSLEMLESRIKSIVEDKTKATMSLLQAMKIIEKREMISAEVIKNISEESDKYYVEIVNVLITNIDFSDAFEKAVEDKMIAEQDQLKAKYEKEKAIIQAEQALEVAKKEADAQLEKAIKEAKATEVRAEAEAKALQIVQAAWDSIDIDVREIMLQEMAIENWDGKLPETMVGTEFLEWLMGAINAPVTP